MILDPNRHTSSIAGLAHVCRIDLVRSRSQSCDSLETVGDQSRRTVEVGSLRRSESHQRSSRLLSARIVADRRILLCPEITLVHCHNSIRHVCSPDDSRICNCHHLVAAAHAVAVLALSAGAQPPAASSVVLTEEFGHGDASAEPSPSTST